MKHKPLHSSTELQGKLAAVKKLKADVWGHLSCVRNILGREDLRSDAIRRRCLFLDPLHEPRKR